MPPEETTPITNEPRNRHERRHGRCGSGGELRMRTLNRKYKRDMKRIANPRLKSL